jgi:hypothetical protein
MKTQKIRPNIVISRHFLSTSTIILCNNPLPTMLPTPSTLATVVSPPRKRKLATTIQQMKSTLHSFKEQDRIKDIMDIDEFIDPVTEKMEDLIDPIALEEDIIASYSLTPEDVPDENIDPVVPIRPAQALAAIQTLRDWELQQDDSTQEVVRQLRTLEKRVKYAQFTRLQQRTLTSYFP